MINIDWQSMPPSQNGHEMEETFFPRLKDNGSINLEKLCTLAAKGNNFSRAELFAAACYLVREIGRQLQHGRTVSIDELGSFRLKLAAKGKVTRQRLSHKDAVLVRDVRFTPASHLMNTLKDTSFHWTPNVTGGNLLTDDTILEKLTAYFESHSSITRKAFEELFRLKRSTANYRLRALVKDDILEPVGTGPNIEYILKRP